LANVAIDYNGDGKIQSNEYLPGTLLTDEGGQVSAETIFADLVEKAAKLPLSTLKSLGVCRTFKNKRI